MSSFISFQETLQTEYENVKLFHQVFDHPCESSLRTNIFKEDINLVNNRISLIDEEINEFVDAVSTNDFIELVDAICDILYVVNGTYISFGFGLEYILPLSECCPMINNKSGYECTNVDKCDICIDNYSLVVITDSVNSLS
jgi:predicted HAD superfamily Cof-like phosphohydrolase